MTTVGTVARARRTFAAVVLGSLGALLGGVLLAPDASAGTTVSIGKTAPAPLTVQPGDTVTFVNGIAPLPVTVPGVVPVNATALTDVVLGGACGGHTLAPGASYVQAFGQTGTCSIGYAYAAQGAPLSAVQLPPLPSPTSVLVTVVQAASSAVGSVAPPLPPLPGPAPAPMPVPVPAPAPGGGAVGSSGSGTGSSGGSGGGTTVVSGGSGGSGSGGSGSAVPGAASGAAGTTAVSPPSAPAAASAFDPARSTAGSGLRSGGQSGPGVLSSRNRALSALEVAAPKLNGSAPVVAPAASSPGGSAPALPMAALAAVVALSGVIAALVRTHLAARAER